MMEFQDPMSGLDDSIRMVHPLIYGQDGRGVDEETSYAWTCVKYARDVTSHQPHDTYVQRARKAFRDRWIVAPRRRAEDPALSPFWPRDRDFARGFQPSLPFLHDEEFKRQDERTIIISREYIRKAKKEMTAMKAGNRRLSRSRRDAALHSTRLMPEGSSPQPQAMAQFGGSSSEESTPPPPPCAIHEVGHVNMPYEPTRYQLPPLQIRSRNSGHNSPRNLPSLRVMLRFRHSDNGDADWVVEDQDSA